MTMIFAVLKRLALPALLSISLCSTHLRAQEDEFKVNIYGAVASNFYVFTNNREPALGNGQVSNTFALLQGSLFFSGNIGNDWKYLIELYMQNDFIAQLNVGQALLHQAWIEYRPSSEFGVRFGRMLTPYAGFNNIHSRPALYWFVQRPFPYEEPTLTDGIDGVRSEFSSLMLSGALKIGDGAKFDYAAYAGNTERIGLNGFDFSAAKTIGARVGVRTDNITFGVSPVINVIADVDDVAQENVTLLAGDIQANFGNFKLIGEYIYSLKNFEAKPNTTGFQARNYENHTANFFYASAGYDISEQWLVYVAYNFFNDTESGSIYRTQPLTRMSAGVNFRPIEKIILKAEVNHHPYTTAQRPSYQSLGVSLVATF